MAFYLNDSMIFLKVAEHGSFTAAAKHLRLPKSTVSRRVVELELQLGAQLLHRTTRRLGLTEAGHVYLQYCQRIAQELDEAENAMGHLQGNPRGQLRVAASYEIGTEWIAPLLGKLRRRHPEVRVELVLDAFGNDSLDLIERGIDVAVRAGKLPDSNLAARRLAVLHTHVYATHRYVELHGEPVHPDDLSRHQTLAMAKHYRHGLGYGWSLRNGAHNDEFRIEPALVSNDPACLRVAMMADEGLMLAGDVMAKRYGEVGAIRRVLSDWSGPDFELNAVFPRSRVASPKVRAFVDFLVESLELTPIERVNHELPRKADSSVGNSAYGSACY